jgi:hypothetical protein
MWALQRREWRKEKKCTRWGKKSERRAMRKKMRERRGSGSEMKGKWINKGKENWKHTKKIVTDISLVSSSSVSCHPRCFHLTCVHAQVFINMYK